MQELPHHIRQMLKNSNELVKESPHLIEEVGVINSKGDRTIEMDKKLENSFLTYVQEHDLPVAIYSEESDDILLPHQALQDSDYSHHPLHSIGQKRLQLT